MKFKSTAVATATLAICIELLSVKTAFVIRSPIAGSVVRTQSVQVELESDELYETTFLELDGKKVFETSEQRVSLILADEQGMSEGVHNITWWAINSHEVKLGGIRFVDF